ncbi:HTH-type transcriptional repressor yvoA, partial [Dysosmobacter welbionis]
MVADPGLPVSHLRGKEGPAGGAEGVVKPQGIRHIRQAVARDGPVGDVIVDLFGSHVVDILGVVGAALRLAGADELIGLKDDIADAALPDPGILPALGVDPVHYNTGHRLHAVFTLSARLALDQARQQLPVGISHWSITPLSGPAIRTKRRSGRPPGPDVSPSGYAQGLQKVSAAASRSREGGSLPAKKSVSIFSGWTGPAGMWYTGFSANESGGRGMENTPQDPAHLRREFQPCRNRFTAFGG